MESEDRIHWPCQCITSPNEFGRIAHSPDVESVAERIPAQFELVTIFVFISGLRSSDTALSDVYVTGAGQSDAAVGIALLEVQGMALACDPEKEPLSV